MVRKILSFAFTYTMPAPASAGIILLVTLTVVGALILILAFRKGVRWVRKMIAYFAAMTIVGVVLIGLDVGLYYVASTPSQIIVGSGYLSVESPSYFGAGNMNITTSEVSGAYVGQIGPGNLSLSKQYGTNAGNLNIGVFTLGNGATAYVVSNNSTDLIIRLNTGKYVILGTPNTSALASAFSQFVYPR